MFGLSTIDLVVIALYFLVLIIIGFRAMRRVHSQEDYFLGGRRFGKLIQVFAAFGQATSADTGPSVATTTMNNGASGIWSALMMLFSTPSYWFTAVWYRRLRLLTMGDFFEERFASRWLGGSYAVLASISLTILLSVGFISMSKTVLVMTPKTYSELSIKEKHEYDQSKRLEKLENTDYLLLTPGEKQEIEELRQAGPASNFSHINKATLIGIIVLIVTIYSVAGGLEAAFISDMMQGIFIIILSIMLLPFAFARINAVYGGEGMMDALRSIHNNLPESFFEIFGSPNSIDFTWYYIIAIGIMATINVAVGANQLVATGSARTEYNARFGLTYGTYLKRITTVLWGVTALAAVVLFGSKVTDPDLLWGFASRELLGSLNFGLIGLMIAALMAALMSTADMMMITASGLLTHSIYRPFFPGRSEKHYVTTGRLLGAVVVVGAAMITMMNDSIFGQLKVLWEFGMIYAAGFWLGILWRRTNRYAVWTSIVFSLVVFFILPAALPVVNPSLRYNHTLLEQTKVRVVSRTYTATAADVEQRREEIARWKERSESGLITADVPEELAEGDVFTRNFSLPRKAIYWTRGLAKDADGQSYGQGQLSLELVLYHSLGWDLSQHAYALNETLRVLTRTLIPFFVIILLSLLTSHPENERQILNAFYVKMKSPVRENRQEDMKEMAYSLQNPHRFDHLLLFPNTQWQFTKWNRTDTLGFLFSILMVVLILLFLYFAVNLGGKINL
ncbi:MAG TPA: sodium:solute symporter family protein [Bacteroidales bacterium]|nr:sodium:solute symporter family protein [Bacteroidales bacterium]